MLDAASIARTPLSFGHFDSFFRHPLEETGGEKLHDGTSWTELSPVPAPHFCQTVSAESSSRLSRAPVLRHLGSVAVPQVFPSLLAYSHIVTQVARTPAFPWWVADTLPDFGRKRDPLCPGCQPELPGSFSISDKERAISCDRSGPDVPVLPYQRGAMARRRARAWAMDPQPFVCPEVLRGRDSVGARDVWAGRSVSASQLWGEYSSTVG